MSVSSCQFSTPSPLFPSITFCVPKLFHRTPNLQTVLSSLSETRRLNGLKWRNFIPTARLGPGKAFSQKSRPFVIRKILGIFHNDTSFHSTRAMKYNFPGPLQEPGGVTEANSEHCASPTSPKTFATSYFSISCWSVLNHKQIPELPLKCYCQHGSKTSVPDTSRCRLYF